jgi:pimeloyl-ACP methyl ester carboxylesterase
MAFATAVDGTRIYLKDWGSGPPVVFSHGRPLTADAWDRQLKLVADNGFRAVAPTAAGADARTSRGRATTSTHTLTTWPRSSRLSTSATSSWSDTRRVGERSHAISAGTARVVSPRPSCSARYPR